MTTQGSLFADFPPMQSAPPPAATPEPMPPAQDLGSKAMLVRLGISQWTGRKKDKRITGEVLDNAGADRDSGLFTKRLMSSDLFTEIKRKATAARTFHYEQTLPWGDLGERIISSANWFNYSEQMRQFKADFLGLVAQIPSQYDDILTVDRARLNGMFCSADYPDAWQMVDKFSFDIDVSPLPTAGDFRVALQAGEVAQIQQSISERLERAQAAAMADLWDRLHDAVAKAADSLGQPDKIFRDTLIGNLVDLCGLLPRLNLTGDAELERLRQRVEGKLANYNPQDLRDDQELRKEAAQEAQAVKTDVDSIMAAMGGYMGGAN